MCQWFWRLGRRDRTHPSWTVEPPTPLTEFCFGIPPELERVDAVFERPSDGRVFIFSGKHEIGLAFFRPSISTVSSQFVPYFWLDLCSSVDKAAEQEATRVSSGRAHTTSKLTITAGKIASLSLPCVIRCIFTTRRSYASAVLGVVILSVCHTRAL